jgi:hypothetical protein
VRNGQKIRGGGAKAAGQVIGILIYYNRNSFESEMALITLHIPGRPGVVFWMLHGVSHGPFNESPFMFSHSAGMEKWIF